MEWVSRKDLTAKETAKFKTTVGKSTEYVEKIMTTDCFALRYNPQGGIGKMLYTSKLKALGFTM